MRRASAFSRFWRPKAKFICKSIENQADEFKKNLNDSPFLFSETPFIPSRSLDEDKHCYDAKAKRVETEVLEETKKRKERKWKDKESSSSGSYMSLLKHCLHQTGSR